MKSALLACMLLLIVFLALGPTCGRGNDDPPLTVDGPKKLRSCTMDVWDEFERCPEGRLLLYNSYLPDRPRFYDSPKEPVPMLELYALKWEERDGHVQMMSQHGDLWIMQLDKQSGYHHGENGFKPVKDFIFFDLLKTNCGDLSPNADSDKPAGTGKGSKNPGALDPVYRFVHRNTAEGFAEYEFRSNGDLLAYLCNEKNTEVEKVPKAGERGLVQPRFSVTILRWKKAGDHIEVHHGSRKEILTIHANADTKTLSSGNAVWKPVKHLHFIPKLYAYCKRPLPRFLKERWAASEVNKK